MVEANLKRTVETTFRAPKRPFLSISPTPEQEKESKAYLNPEIFYETYRKALKLSVAQSEPYRWGHISQLVDDKLLRDVRSEILKEIHFTKKETDIYKVYQSGDLANLSGLDWSDLSRLPNLFKLRNAIYSQGFRDFISEVTGCGKLSGVKTDMSLNTYTKGCHLLTHDDVIGSRRVSFILYIPEPGKTWKPHYGGALRLFDSIVPNVPRSDYHCKFVPQFNQMAFFTVQPGLSFHEVEEVKVDRHRLSIQGWFHIPQRGEDGFIPGEQERTEAKSTLQQLESKELREFDFPKIFRNEINPEVVKSYESAEGLTQAETEYLSKYLNKSLLSSEAITKMKALFDQECMVDIQEFLSPKFADLLSKSIKKCEFNTTMPRVQKDVKFPWKLAIPPHKQRFMYMDGLDQQNIDTAADIQFANGIAPQELPNFGLTRNVAKSEVDRELCTLSEMFRSNAFRKYIALITGLIACKDQVLVRRFRPGHDFILATELEEEPTVGILDCVLEATMNLTPTTGWESGELGGYELCMVTNDEEQQADEKLNEDEAAIYKENDDSVVFTSQASWNTLNLILRDPKVLKFVKYVSNDAPGSRWDISCSWNVKDIFGKDEEEENEGEGDE
ncbi:unnamed protein product [Kuraishia capsulata CBS 1993]|uniref:uS12 prolyl 3,4-dihydroxylase n=1 Tax=Kuraishia capsulata CBS 1993 TaxID=1382522 RepID=W6MJA3_9ASCO|nr:uncharacterized protein KUCA_T00002312001 [Kuraishia capsulata CBS 1993]CDK26341.1 unnamed protein product [Kuraishia capsulata CBS 1993]